MKVSLNELSLLQMVKLSGRDYILLIVGPLTKYEGIW